MNASHISHDVAVLDFSMERMGHRLDASVEMPLNRQKGVNACQTVLLTGYHEIGNMANIVFAARQHCIACATIP